MGNRGTHPHSRYRKRRCGCVQTCEVSRRKKLVVLDHTFRLLPMVPVCKAHLEHDGPAHETRVPRTRAGSVKSDLSSPTVAWARYSSIHALSSNKSNKTKEKGWLSFTRKRIYNLASTSLIVSYFYVVVQQ